jgi:hypothetical protein
MSTGDTPTSIRLQLKAAGFAPLPLNGKAPKSVRGWQDKLDSTADEIKLWEKLYPYDHNTGLLTRLVPTIDIDIMHPEAAEAIEALAREHFEERGDILVRVGKPPKRAIMLRTDEPFSKLTRGFAWPNGSGQIEILADGQQVVAFGVHPDTKQPYRWHGGEPGAVNREDLPYVRQGDIEKFLDAASALLVEQFGFTSKGGSKPKAGNGEAAPHDPVDWGVSSARILAGEHPLHDSIRDLAASFIGSGMSEKAAIERLRSLMTAGTATKDARWREYYDDIPRAVRTARKKFEPEESSGDAKKEDAPACDLGEWDAGDDPGPIPPRQWLLGNQFCAGFISSIVAAGGAGKSALRLLQFISLATGRPLAGQHVFRRCRVLLISLEDDQNELDRRIKGVLDYFNISRSELKGWLFCASPKLAKLAEMKNKTRVIGPLESQLRAAIERRKPDIISLDPFVKTHGLEENDSGDMDFVCDLLAQLAVEFDIAVDSPHHVHKGQIVPGDADSGRGSSGIRDAGRLVYTLVPMSEDEARIFSINPDERYSYIRLDSAKVNIDRRSGKATWFRLVGVLIGNATPEYPNGDTVQVVEPWSPPETWAGLDSVLLNFILSKIDAGLPDGNYYTATNSATDRAAWKVVQSCAPDKSEAQAREVIAAWLKTGLLVKFDYTSPTTRQEVKGLKVDSTKRPT